jgi:hypothetical protein
MRCLPPDGRVLTPGREMAYALRSSTRGSAHVAPPRQGVRHGRPQTPAPSGPVLRTAGRRRDPRGGVVKPPRFGRTQVLVAVIGLLGLAQTACSVRKFAVNRLGDALAQSGA